MEQAIQYMREHPDLSCTSVAEQFKVDRKTLSNRVSRKTQSRQEAAHRKLSLEAEQVIVDKIQRAASYGALLEPRHVKELAEALSGERVGVNWVSKFVKRHRDQLTSQYFGYKSHARVKANTDEVRRAFNDVVCLIGCYCPR